MNTATEIETAHPIQVSHETASTAVAAHAKALVEARYIVAMKHPRDIDQVRERLLKECKRPGFARVARYRKPIGKGIEGPSIRFAEAAIRCMTNIVVESMTLYDDREKRIIQVNVTDLEANVPYTTSVTVEKTVERRKIKDGDVVLRERLNSEGITVYLIEATEDDILNKQNSYISKSIRNSGLRLVPGDIVEECMWQVLETQKNADAKDPDGAKLHLFDSFGILGVTVSQLKEYIGHDGATLTPKELIDLRALYSAIKDGETNWREIMENRDSKEPKIKKPIFGAKAEEKTPTQTLPNRDSVISEIEDFLLVSGMSEKAFLETGKGAGIISRDIAQISDAGSVELLSAKEFCAKKAGAK